MLTGGEDESMMMMMMFMMTTMVMMLYMHFYMYESIVGAKHRCLMYASMVGVGRLLCIDISIPMTSCLQ